MTSNLSNNFYFYFPYAILNNNYWINIKAVVSDIGIYSGELDNHCFISHQIMESSYLYHAKLLSKLVCEIWDF